ncbi:hypothetical protein [Natrinema gelatinilyticum]|uniref:hypothetical protein n=1 Tax=Natrinema gelatinilyticum TaxID=2961571 RepID=UPI0020C2E36A|nr:hypothetical protein [Natrinema gelatinilyticum]
MTANDDTPNETMADVSHTNPYTGEVAGQLFSRGPTVAADGGMPETEADAVEGSTDAKLTMRDVDHTPPNSADDANRVFERGTEYGRRGGRSATVEDDK